MSTSTNPKLKHVKNLLQDFAMFIHVNNQRLFFDVVGEKLKIDGKQLAEKPILIALHGGPGLDHSRFRPEFDALADIVQVIYLDHRGNGRSMPSEPSTWTLDQWADDVKGLCDALGISKPIVLGHSFGGMVAQSYLTRYPDHPAGVVLSSTAAHMDYPAMFDYFQSKGGLEAREAAQQFWTRMADEDLEPYSRLCLPLYATRPPVDADQAARAIVNPQVTRHFAISPGELQAMDFRPKLKAAKCPVLVVGGTSDPATPPACSEEIAASLPSNLTELRLFEGCGHGVYRDDPDRFWPLLRNWILGLTKASQVV
jgi:proline iminopeptidase